MDESDHGGSHTRPNVFVPSAGTVIDGIIELRGTIAKNIVVRARLKLPKEIRSRKNAVRARLMPRLRPPPVHRTRIDRIGSVERLTAI